MKKNDLALLILLVSITLVVSYFSLNAIIGDPSGNTQTVERVPEISSEVPEPSKEVFNDRAIDPAVVIEIGNPSNQQPFQ